jgi:hypothetical protein
MFDAGMNYIVCGEASLAIPTCTFWPPVTQPEQLDRPPRGCDCEQTTSVHSPSTGAAPRHTRRISFPR